jgi:uncharacterized protein
MKILFFSDLHGDFNTLIALKKKARDVDYVVSAGDITVMENDIQKIMRELNKFPKPVLLVHGNHEDEYHMKEICTKHSNLTFIHKGVHHVGEYIFMGYGGDGFSTNDSEFLQVANMFFKPESNNKKRMIFVTHGPPHNTVIDMIGNDPRGNKSYRKFIDEVKPHLVVSGHLHENAGKHHKIDRTLLINPGKEGAIVEI